MASPSDWQMKMKEVKQRGEYLLQSGQWSDCRFIVGTDPHQILEGHKLFLAMSSPVFEAMFFGGMPEKDPISIQDVQPEAFKALLEYIYTDKINLSSFDQACELCYAAKKYMLPHLVEECTKYIWSDLYPKNACRAYEFAKLFEEPILMDKCMEIIRSQTQKVLSESSFDDVELSTILKIFDEEYLNIDSEMELFEALSRFVVRHHNNSGVKVPRLEGVESPASENSSVHPTVRDALMKIRFLTFNPQQFAEGPASSELLTQSEKFAILMNISSPSTDIPMPEGFSMCTFSRKKVPKKLYLAPGMNYQVDTSQTLNYNKFCIQPGSSGLVVCNPKAQCIREPIPGTTTTDACNNSVLDCSLTFMVDKNICVYGIQVPSQVLGLSSDNMHVSKALYNELLYAHLLDAEGSRLTYTHFTSRVEYFSLIEISFNRPIFIQRNKVYKIGVVLNKQGWYPIGNYTNHCSCKSVLFSFGVGQCNDSVRDGLVRSIIFTGPS